MLKSRFTRFAGFIGAAGVTAALVGTAVSGTGAYFNDTADGTISSTFGSIEIDTTNTTLSFPNMLPGETQSQTVGFTNVGVNPQDVWVVFDQDDIGDFDYSTDTNLINDKGTYGAAVVKIGGTPVFLSNNMNDDPTVGHCPNQALLLDPVACHGLPHMLLLQENLPAGGFRNMAFEYTPAAKYKVTNLPSNMPFMPIDYHIVATQHGITPDNVLNTTPVG